MTNLHALPTDVMTTCTDGLLYCFAIWARDVTNGAFWVIALLTFCVALFMAIASTPFGSIRAFGFAGFVGLLGGIFLAVLQLIPWWIGTVFIIVGVLGLAALLINEK